MLREKRLCTLFRDNKGEDIFLNVKVYFYVKIWNAISSSIQKLGKNSYLGRSGDTIFEFTGSILHSFTASVASSRRDKEVHRELNVGADFS